MDSCLEMGWEEPPPLFCLLIQQLKGMAFKHLLGQIQHIRRNTFLFIQHLRIYRGIFAVHFSRMNCSVGSERTVVKKCVGNVRTVDFRILQIALRNAQLSQKSPLNFKDLGIFHGFFLGLAHPLLYGYRAQKTAQSNPPKLIDSRRIEMLMIKDLAVSRELDTKAMSAVRGGFAANVTNAPQTISFGGDLKNSPVTIVGPITTNTAVDMSQVVSHMPKAYPTPSYDSYGSSDDWSSGYGSYGSSGYGA